MLASMGASGTLSCELVNTGATDDSLGESYGMPERKIQKGDRLFAIMEANGAGQQHVAFGRHIIFGEPTAYMRKAVEDEIKAHKYAASLMKADGETTLAKIAVKTRKFVNGLGYSLQEQVGWNWMHSLGSFIYEQYSVEDYTENIPLREGIILHCHPKLYSYYQDEQNRILRREVFILNTYRVTKDGPEDLINLPFDPIILN
jgi:Xaa-Pro aminopeptidase